MSPHDRIQAACLIVAFICAAIACAALLPPENKL